jgi:ABC-2 type transport system ATP-binding protein/nitrous oxidase accessory protein
MITFDHVTKRYGSTVAVNDLSLEVPREAALALWGPNGAGKTTLIRCLLGLLRYEGRIRIGDLDAHRQGRAARRLLGYVPQEIALYPDLSVLDTAHFFARLRQAPDATIAPILTQVGLDDHRAKPVAALSGGLKQRLALGLALLGDPPVLVLDEPTSNLDRASRDDFLALLDTVRHGGKTILYTSHRLEEIERLADEVIVMQDGRIDDRCPAGQLAQRLGLRRTVKLHVAPAALEQALRVLQADGYAARRNGRGVLVDVAADAKAAPIQLLGSASIPVSDFEME